LAYVEEHHQAGKQAAMPGNF